MIKNILHTENKLKMIFQFYNSKRVKQTKKVSKEQLTMFKFSDEDKAKMIDELARVAFETNKIVFDYYKESGKNLLRGGKINDNWITENFNLLNDNTRFVEKFEQIKKSRIDELVVEANKVLDGRLNKDTLTKTDIKKIKNTMKAQGKANKRITELVNSMDSRALTREERKELLDWNNRRNYLSARNETGNIYAEETKDLFIKNGISEYKWETKKDNRVRESHRDRQGRRFKIGVGIMPGEEFGCRCWAKI